MTRSTDAADGRATQRTRTTCSDEVRSAISALREYADRIISPTYSAVVERRLVLSEVAALESLLKRWIEAPA